MRIGTFLVSGQLIRELKMHNNEVYSWLNKIMRNMVIVKTESEIWNDTIKYTALSPDFDDIEIGHLIPSYQITIDAIGERISINRNYTEENTLTINENER